MLQWHNILSVQCMILNSWLCPWFCCQWVFSSLKIFLLCNGISLRAYVGEVIPPCLLLYIYTSLLRCTLHCNTKFNLHTHFDPWLIRAEFSSYVLLFHFSMFFSYCWPVNLWILVGTDTICDVRIPASFCGLLSFRPSYGVISTLGTIANSQSLDTIGISCLSQYFLLLYLLITLTKKFISSMTQVEYLFCEHVVVPCVQGL